MVSDAGNDKVVEAIVGTVQGTSYPDADVAASEIPPTILHELSRQLDGAKKTVESQVRVLSQEVAPDVDEWISRAKQVQADIKKSKVTARSIVEQAEAQATLRRSAEDAGQKVTLLESELKFSNGLQTALLEIKSALAELSQAKEHLVEYQLQHALDKIKSCDLKLDKMETAYAPNAGQALRTRLRAAKQDLKDLAEDGIQQGVRVDLGHRILDLATRPDQRGDVTLDTCCEILAQLGSLKDVAANMSSKINQAFFLPWTSTATETRSWRLKIDGSRAEGIDSNVAVPVQDALKDMRDMISLLGTSLPQPLYSEVAQMIGSQMVRRLEDNVLTPSIPLDVEQLGALDILSLAVGTLSEECRSRGWPGSDSLQEWQDGAPRLWLARQREHTLGAVRQALAKDLRHQRQAEKVSIPSDEDAPADEDEWAEQWNDEPAVTKSASATARDEDDGSAWDTEANDSADLKSHATKDMPPSVVPTSRANADGLKLTTRRETYMITGVPEALMQACGEVLAKARSMTGDDFSQSAVSTAVSALYSIPTLAAALYRAMAVTAYDHVENGKLLLHNDATRLAEQFETLTNAENAGMMTSSNKRKMQQEVTAFENFAKLAYGAEMESQKTILYDLMDGAQGFTNCTTSPFAEECDSAIDMSVDRVGRVHQQWQPVLPKSTLLESIGGLLSAVATKFMLDVQELADIGEEESRKLLSFSNKISQLSGTFKEHDAQTGEERDLTAQYCPNWFKLQYLGEVLDGSLADIKYLWTEGELSLEFDEDEVCDLMRALFADSEHRRKAISAIRSSRRG